MTVDELLAHFDTQDIESQEMNDVEGKALVLLKQYYHWNGEPASVHQFLVLFDPDTRTIKAIKLYGINLQSAEEYIREYGCYFWNPVLHSMSDYDSFIDTLLLITSF